MAKEILVIKHIEIEGPGTIEYYFQNASWFLKTINLAADDIFPSDLKNIKAIITLGGPMNVYEEAEYSFLRDEDAFLKKAIQKEIPILGICLGAQLLAKACNAKVNKAPEKEIGWHKINLTAEGRKDLLFSGLPKEFETFQWHEDAFDIPRGAAHLAESQSCPNQAFRYGKNAYGFQFHVEVTPAIIGSWISAYIREEEGKLDAKNILLDAYKKRKIFEKQANTIYANFMKIIEYAFI